MHAEGHGGRHKIRLEVRVDGGGRMHDIRQPVDGLVMPGGLAFRSEVLLEFLLPLECHCLAADTLGSVFPGNWLPLGMQVNHQAAVVFPEPPHPAFVRLR